MVRSAMLPARSLSIASVIALAVSATSTTACRGLKPAPPAEDPEDQQMLAKLQGYIRCVEDYSAPIFAVADVFRRDPTNLSGIAEVDDPDKCINVMTAAKAREPHILALEAA